MRYLLVDDEKPALKYLIELLIKLDPTCYIDATSKGNKALKQIQSVDYDAIFLDINLGKENGISIAQSIKKIKSESNLIFITGYSQFALDAFKVNASDYLLKPISENDISHALNSLRYKKIDSLNLNKIEFHCFGNFEMFSEGKPVQFNLQKSKEALAYLVHKHGISCSNNEVMTILWENDTHDSYIRQIRKDLSDTFKSINAEKYLLLQRGYIGLQNIDEIECDYFRFLKDDIVARHNYHGEYMAQYSWAEEFNAILSNQLIQNNSLY